MIQWVHAGIGILILLVLCIFMIVYIGVFGTRQRICGAPMPGARGKKGLPGLPGIALFAGATGDPSTEPGEEGDTGPDAVGINTGPTPLPASTGLYTGPTGMVGWKGIDGPVITDGSNAPPIDFKVENNGIGTSWDQYQDTKYFPVTVTSSAGNPSSMTTQVRFVRLGATVYFHINQIQFVHGVATTDDWINFTVTEFDNAPRFLYNRFFFQVSPQATTRYYLEQPIIVYDSNPAYWTDGAFHLEISPGNVTVMRIQWRARYSPDADSSGSFPLMKSKFPASSTGTFGLVSHVVIKWTLI